MIRNLLIASALAVSASPLPAEKSEKIVAEYKAIEAKNIQKGTAKIDPAKGYILISATVRNYGTFIKTPSADEVATYEAEWKREFEKAKEKYPGKLESWKTNAALAVGQGRKGPPKPVEPTEQNFSIGGLDQRMIVAFGPMFVYEKAKAADGSETFSYLIEVEPGEYSYYGMTMLGPEGGMGSVKLQANAGEITNLGDFLSLGWVEEAGWRVNTRTRAAPQGWVPRPVAYPVPESLKSYVVKPAELRAAGKRDNFYGVMIGRMPPVPGVLAYERDTVIDVHAKLAAEAAAREATAAATEAPAPVGGS